MKKDTCENGHSKNFIKIYKRITINHWKRKYNFLTKVVNNIPSWSSLFHGVKDKQILSKIEKKSKLFIITTHIIRTNCQQKEDRKTDIIESGETGCSNNDFLGNYQNTLEGVYITKRKGNRKVIGEKQVLKTVRLNTT